MNVIKKIIKLMSILVFGFVLNMALIILVIRCGLLPRVQVLLVTTSITTLNHQYIGRIFATQKDIERIMEANRVDYDTVNSDKQLIKITAQPGSYVENAADETGCMDPRRKRKKAFKDTIELVNISGNGYKGHMLIVSNPRRVKLVSTKGLGKEGTKLNKLIKDNHGIGGINAGGFKDDGGVGNGGTPTGVIIENGKITFWDKGTGNYSIIGLDSEGVLILGNYSIDQIKAIDIVYGVYFYPFLIVNGKPTTIHGDGGWGINPRTAIGQREDGAILMLVIDGRQVSSVGASIKEIQKIMVQYGAVNAANLDGGSSTVMYYNNKLVNKPCSPYGERPLPTAFIITEDLQE